MTRTRRVPGDQSQRRERQGRLPGGSREWVWVWHAAAIAIALVLGIAAYGNALDGKFVYDDELQIVNNPLIHQPEQLWKALTSDVWAFQGEREAAWSNYWRPLFVVWMKLNLALFGLEPFGWHLTSLALHLLVTMLAYFVLVSLGLHPAVCAVVAWLFAVHPVHVETVAWASGSPDLLMSVFVLGGYLCYLRATGRLRLPLALASGLLYACALLSKEGAVMFPAIVIGMEWIRRGGLEQASSGLAGGQESAGQEAAREERQVKQLPGARSPVSPRGGGEGARQGEARPLALSAVRAGLPFVALAALFVIVRYAVLGQMRVKVIEGATLGEAMITVPSVLLFQLRQLLLPLWLGPVHGLRALSVEGRGLAIFGVSLLAIAGIASLWLAAARRNWAYGVGLLLFIVPLALSLDIRAFEPERIVQDRYLYLPLLGILVVIVQGLAYAAGRLRRSAA